MLYRPLRPTLVGALTLLALSLVPCSSAFGQGVLLDFEILYEINGEAQGDLLGASTDGIGDVDGDGRGDFVVGIQREDPGGVVNAGTARVFSGADGSVLFTFTGTTQAGAFGNEVRGAGDVNADGVPDIIVGAILDDRNGLNQAGSATVFSGADGSVLHVFEGGEATALLGRAVDGAGDVNGDGYADLIVGQTDDRAGTDAGSVRVFSGADGSLLYDILGAAPSDAFGASVAGIGDVDGDGFDDFAAGARNADDAFGDAGRVRVFSGQTGALLYTYDGSAPGAIMHIVNNAGDVDADGVPDFLIGSPGADEAGVYSGLDGSLIYALQGNSAGDGFGSRLAGIGDANNDGSPDVLIAAPSDDRNGPGAGSVTVFSGADGAVMFTLDGDPGDRLGSGVGGLGDVNGDVCDDFVVGAFFDDNSFTNSGSAKIMVFSGEVCAPDTNAPAVTITAPAYGLVVGTTSVLLEATVLDDSSTQVTSDPAGLDVSLAAGGGPVSAVLPLAVEGENDLVVSAVDVAGNVGGTAVSVLRDTIAPAVTLVSPVDGAVLASTPVNLTLQVDDATATVATIGAQGVSAPRGGGVVTGSVDLIEGSNLVSIEFVDEAGNATSLQISLTLDLEAPLVSLDSPLDGACFGPGQETAAVGATVDDLTKTTIATNSAGMAASLPAGGGLLSGTLQLVEGLNEVRVSATDEAGRTGAAQVSVLLDTTAPDVLLTSVDPLVPVSGDVDLGARVVDVLPGTGVATVEFLVNGSSIVILGAAPYEAIFDTRTLADGLHTFGVAATDGKGNSSLHELTVLVDNTAPLLAFLSPGDGDFVMGTIPLEVQASDAGAGLSAVTLLAAAQPPTVDPSVVFGTSQGSAFLVGEQDTVPLPDGQLVLRAIARDAAGNEAVALIAVEVDNTAPEKFLVWPSDGDWVTGTIEITADGHDANLDRIEIYVDRDLVGTSKTAPFQVAYDTTAILDGNLTVTAVAYDLAGNVSNCSAHVVVDNMAFSLTPKTLDLQSQGYPVMARVAGPNLPLLLPTEMHAIELRVVGGSPVPAESDWVGDDSVSTGDDPKLQIRFSRRALAQAIRAGIAAGVLGANDPTVEVSLWVDGRELATTLLRVQS